jgi:hypothetical protein
MISQWYAAQKFGLTCVIRLDICAGDSGWLWPFETVHNIFTFFGEKLISMAPL